jgi:hypothetical protein
MSNHLEGLHPGPELSGIIRPLGTPNIAEADVFPPARSQAPDPSIFLPYIPEDISFEEEYEEYISDLGLSDSEYISSSDALFTGGGLSAWSRFPAEFAQDIADGISDSESIVSIGDLGDEGRLDPSRDDGEVVDENLNNWEVKCHDLELKSDRSHYPHFLAFEPQNDGCAPKVPSWPKV